MSFDVQAVQKDLKAANLDGWLFYDFRGRDPIAHRILQLPPGMRTRRWFYFVPAKGAAPSSGPSQAMKWWSGSSTMTRARR